MTAPELGAASSRSSRRRAAADFEAQAGGVRSRAPCAAPSRCATRVRTTSRRSPCRLASSPPRRCAAVFEDFARLYEGFYGYRLDGIPIELVRLSVVATGEEPVPSPAPGRGAATATARRVPAATVFFPGHGFVDDPGRAPLRRLRSGTELDGPVVVEEMDSTIVVPPGWTLSVLPTAECSSSMRREDA